MSNVRINKIDAARRQIDAAIRMTFRGEDPVAIHAVIGGAHRIIRDICEQRGDIDSYQRFTDFIVPGHEGEFWRYWNASVNFLKHADKDPNAIHELDAETTDFLIVITARWYRDLGNSVSEEMRYFAGWWAIMHPDVIKADVIEAAGSKVREFVSAAVHASKQLTRQETLLAARAGFEQNAPRKNF
jgi:hypothetical protein